MSALISFHNLEDGIWSEGWLAYQMLLYHGVIRNSGPDRLEHLYPHVELEIRETLSDIDPERYSERFSGYDTLAFTKYPLEEQREWLAATRRGLEEIRNARSDDEDDLPWDYEDKDRLVAKGELLVDMMARSLAKSESDAAAQGAGPDCSNTPFSSARSPLAVCGPSIVTGRQTHCDRMPALAAPAH